MWIYEKSTEYSHQKEKQDVIVIGMGQTMHRASSSESSRQTVNKFLSEGKTCLITLGIELKIPFDECTMDTCNPIQ